MRLLVTGAAGFIGRNMLLALPRSWEVIALYRPGNPEFLPFVHEHQLWHVRPLACDVTDEQQVKQTIDQVGGRFDACLALAGNTSMSRSVAQPILDVTTNVIGLLHILQCCTFEHLIYLSSGSVYLGLQGLVGPASVVAPTLPYAISKLAAEQYIRAFVQPHGSMKAATIIRSFSVYGPYEPANRLYTKLVCRFAFECNPDFTITGDGENYIDAMYIDDAVKALLAVLTHPTPDGVLCIDLGTGSRASVNQLVARAARTFGLEPQLRHAGSATGYIQFIIDPQPFASTYQFTPSVPLEDGLRRLAAHIR